MATLSRLVLRCISFVLFFSCVAASVESFDEKQAPFSFSFERFAKDDNFGSQIALYGDAEVGSSVVRMFGKGRVMTKKPITFLGTNPGFSTNFSFSVSDGDEESLTFLLVGGSKWFLAVKFVADARGGHIAIDVGGKVSEGRGNLSEVNLNLNSEQKLYSRIDYDGALKKLEVRLAKSRDLRPQEALVSLPIDLSNALWRGAMYAGISSSNGSSNIYSWSFEVNHGAPYLMHSEPLDPKSVSVRSHEELPVHFRRGYPWKILVALVVGAVCGAVVASAVFILRARVVKRHPVAPVEYPAVMVATADQKIALDGGKVSGKFSK